jgi:Helix-turn-helix domain
MRHLSANGNRMDLNVSNKIDKERPEQPTTVEARKLSVPDFDEWLSEEEAAAAAHKSIRTIRKWRRQGRGPPYAYFGRTVRYRKLTFVEHFRQSEITPVRTTSARRGR